LFAALSWQVTRLPLSTEDSPDRVCDLRRFTAYGDQGKHELLKAVPHAWFGVVIQSRSLLFGLPMWGISPAGRRYGMGQLPVS
jgi:hypothetical protein